MPLLWSPLFPSPLFCTQSSWFIAMHARKGQSRVVPLPGCGPGAPQVALLPAISICTRVGKEVESGPQPGPRARLEVTYPNSSLKEAQGRMTARGLRQLPVVLRRFSAPATPAAAGVAASAPRVTPTGDRGAPAAAAGAGAGEGRAQTQALLILGVLDSDDISLACRSDAVAILSSVPNCCYAPGQCVYSSEQYSAFCLAWSSLPSTLDLLLPPMAAGL